jgi:isopentenyl-diphosphate delta-isomerase type 1
MSEYFWVVDEEDHVIGKETREKCHNTKLIHRSVYIFLNNSKKGIFIQKRSMMKDLYPGYYTGSASGHVTFGETYDQAALRELEEELGVKAQLKRIGKFKCFSEMDNEISTVYLCNYDGDITINEDEISHGLFLNLKQIDEEIRHGKKKFPLGFKLALDVYRSSLNISQ